MILMKLRQMGTQGVHMKGVLHWFVHLARRTSTREFCPALAALVGPVLVPIAQQAGQAVVPRRLSLIRCLWLVQLV
jgi:hypothetical protein